LGVFAGTYLSAGLILLASLLVGRAVLLTLGRRRASFLEGAVGLALLVLVSTIAIRLPGNDVTSIACCGALLVASLALLVIRPEGVLGPAVGLALPVVFVSGLAISFPFIASGHIGFPGVGLNNDLAMHLVDVDFLIDPSRPEPQSVVNGYPLGPHSLVATITSLFATQPAYGWFGLLVAAPILTAITALAGLRDLPAMRRLLGALLVAVAYLSASAFGIAGFKELIAGMFLLAFALGLREIEREAEGRIAILIGLAVITAAMVPVYSFPGVAWLAGTAGLWIVAHLVRARAEGGREGLRELIRRAMPIAGPALGVLALAALTQLPRAIDFAQSGAISIVAGTNSKLRFAVSPFETLGVWPSGDWLLSTTDLSAAWLFAAIGVAGALFGLIWWTRRRDFSVPAAVIAGVLVYFWVRLGPRSLGGEGGLYIQMKAVVVPASVVMLLVIRSLLAPDGGWLRRIFAVVFVALAAYSSFLALRDTVVAPDNRLHELEAFRDEVAGDEVLALTSDRFADYGLRSATVHSPAFNAEIRVASTGAKTQRLPIDFDSVPDEVLNQFRYAITTSAVYQSQPPPGWTEVASSQSYKLWRRTSTTPRVAMLAEEARPGRLFRCKNPKFRKILAGGGEALVWPRPVIAKRLYWTRAGKVDNQAQPGEEVGQSIFLPPGRWQVSLQYVSPVTGVTVRAPGLDVHLPVGMDAAIPYRPDQGPYWPVGELTSQGGPVTISVRADEINWLQKFLGVDAPAVIGNLTAVQTTGFQTVPTASACGRYVDHVIGGREKSAVREAGKAVPKRK
jgi:hypothetical protein